MPKSDCSEPLASYENWLRNATAGTYMPIPTERLAEMFAATCRYGSGNDWTGTTGGMAKMVRELLREVEHLRNERGDYAAQG